MSKLGILAVTAGLLLVGSGLRAQEPQTPAPAGDKQKSQSWSGTLVDADCITANSAEKKCDVSETTKSFGLQTSDGKVYKFDDQGNAKVRAALSANNKTSGAVMATVKGSMDGDTLKIDTIEIR
jgi:hypothetical protein